MLDSFRAHYTQPVIDGFERANSRSAIIPGGCTSKIQPLDVSINRPFKDSLKRSWVGYMESQVNAGGAGMVKIPKPSKQLVLNWVVAAWRELQKRPELIRRSFKVCGISNDLDGDEDELVRCSKYISEDLKEPESEDLDEDLFEEFDLEDC